jgi:hypothetical protein
LPVKKMADGIWRPPTLLSTVSTPVLLATAATLRGAATAGVVKQSK